MKVYMEVTQDEYELPLAIADSPAELARMCGVNPNAVSSAISHWKSGKHPRSRFIVVKIDEEDDDDE